MDKASGEIVVYNRDKNNAVVRAKDLESDPLSEIMVKFAIKP